jgi:hypothetical protein
MCPLSSARATVSGRIVKPPPPPLPPHGELHALALPAFLLRLLLTRLISAVLQDLPPTSVVHWSSPPPPSTTTLEQLRPHRRPCSPISPAVDLPAPPWPSCQLWPRHHPCPRRGDCPSAGLAARRDMGRCHTPFRERWNEASIRVPRMFKPHVRPTIW